MGKGFFSPRSTSSYYVQEFSVWRDPKMWKSAVSIYTGGAITAALVIAFLLGGKADEKDGVAPRPTVTVTVYKAPVGHE